VAGRAARHQTVAGPVLVALVELRSLVLVVADDEDLHQLVGVGKRSRAPLADLHVQLLLAPVDVVLVVDEPDAGCLGATDAGVEEQREHGPFELVDPSDAVQDLRRVLPLEHVGRGLFEIRHRDVRERRHQLGHAEEPAERLEVVAHGARRYALFCQLADERTFWSALACSWASAYARRFSPLCRLPAILTVARQPSPLGSMFGYRVRAGLLVTGDEVARTGCPVWTRFPE